MFKCDLNSFNPLDNFREKVCLEGEVGEARLAVGEEEVVWEDDSKGIYNPREKETERYSKNNYLRKEK